MFLSGKQRSSGPVHSARGTPSLRSMPSSTDTSEGTIKGPQIRPKPYCRRGTRPDRHAAVPSPKQRPMRTQTKRGQTILLSIKTLVTTKRKMEVRPPPTTTMRTTFSSLQPPKRLKSLMRWRQRLDRQGPHQRSSRHRWQLPQHRSKGLRCFTDGLQSKMNSTEEKE